MIQTVPTFDDGDVIKVTELDGMQVLFDKLVMFVMGDVPLSRLDQGMRNERVICLAVVEALEEIVKSQAGVD